MPGRIIKAVRRVVGPGPVALHTPSIGTVESNSVLRALHGNPVGYDYIDLLQEKLATVCGVEQVSAVASGTAALHLALMAVGVKAYEEVLVPALTFVATANAVVHCGGVPNLVDVRLHDFGINPFKLGRYLARICEKREGGTFNRQSGRRIACLIAVDLLGVPCDMDAIKVECGRWGIPVIEDAAQALGSIYKGRPCGSNGYIGILSFNNNKIVTTNGGGAVLTDDPFIQAKVHSLATTARLAHPWRMEHSEVAWNYRMGNINAALGLPQLERIEKLIEQKSKLHDAYAKELDVGIGTLDTGSRSNYWLNTLILPPLDNRRDEILTALSKDGIACRTLFTPLMELPMYKTNPRDNLEGSYDLWRRAICLPSSPHLAEAL